MLPLASACSRYAFACFCCLRLFTMLPLAFAHICCYLQCFRVLPLTFATIYCASACFRSLLPILQCFRVLPLTSATIYYTSACFRSLLPLLQCFRVLPHQASVRWMPPGEARIWARRNSVVRNTTRNPPFTTAQRPPLPTTQHLVVLPPLSSVIVSILI